MSTETRCAALYNGTYGRQCGRPDGHDGQHMAIDGMHWGGETARDAFLGAWQSPRYAIPCDLLHRDALEESHRTLRAQLLDVERQRTAARQDVTRLNHLLTLDLYAGETEITSREQIDAMLEEAEREREISPAEWRDVKGDLDYHNAKEEGRL